MRPAKLTQDVPHPAVCVCVCVCVCSALSALHSLQSRHETFLPSALYIPSILCPPIMLVIVVPIELTKKEASEPLALLASVRARAKFPISLLRTSTGCLPSARTGWVPERLTTACLRRWEAPLRTAPRCWAEARIGAGALAFFTRQHLNGL
jgi:hypothetical protein